MATVTIAPFLAQVRNGDLAARDRMYEATFARLRLIASRLLSRERPGHTLQPTALVSEVFLKLRGSEDRIVNEDQFFGLAARAMRQVLIDHARVRKHVCKVDPQTVAALLANREQTQPELRLAVRAAFQKLEILSPVVARTVWFRAAEGLTIAEVAKAQAREAWRVRADYDFGIQWMASRIRS